MSSRTLQGLRYTPNFICTQCLQSIRRPAPRVVAGPLVALANGARRWKTDVKYDTAAPRTPAAPKTKTKTNANIPPPLNTPEGLEWAKKNVTIRYYEQDDGGDVHQLEDEGAFTRSLDGIDEMQAELDQEYQDLVDFAEGKGPVAGGFRAEIQRQLRTAVEAASKAAEPPAPAPQVMEQPEIPQISDKPFRKMEQRKLVQKVNSTLERAEKWSLRRGSVSKKTLAPLWKAYIAARRTLALHWDTVPRPVWDSLWKLFSAEHPLENPNRLSHVATLSKDMSAAGVDLTPAQQVLTIEALFVYDWESDAAKNWKRCLPTLGADESPSFKEFWELGVRIFCKLRDVDQAARAAEKLLDKGMDPRILMPVVRTHVEKGNEEGLARSWEMYRRMRGLLGEGMTIADYDQVISYYLSCNQIESALQAFVDMMTPGSAELRSRARLPVTIGNKFFFGKWLKRLIGARELDGAHSVIKFMLEKQVQPAPIHVNGLIGAWQRSGGTKDLEKADEVAWNMIESRLRFVKERRGEEVAAQIEGIDGDVPQPPSAPWPRATLETFSLMAENYRLRQVQEPLIRLWQAFSEAEISHDAFMMNQLLESYLQYGQVDEGWRLYQALVLDGTLKPNPHTFMVLWKMQGVNRTRIPEDQLRNEADNARDTFREMMRSAHVFAGEPIDGQLARKILHTFRRLGDTHGFLVALTALRNYFDFSPPELLVLELVIGTTNLAWDTPRARHKLQAEKKKMDVDILERRRAAGKPAVEGSEAIPADERSEELYEYLTRYYTPVRTGEMALAIDDERLLEEAAQQMGVYGEEGEETGEGEEPKE